MKKIEIYKIPDSLDRQHILAEIAKSFIIKNESSVIQKQIFFDTFDWRLYNQGLIIIREKNNYQLQKLQTEEIIKTARCQSKKCLKFWWEFPDGPLKNSLKSYLDVRALIPLAEIEKDVQTFSILNEDQKSIVQTQFEKLLLIKNDQKIALINTVKLQSARGYRNEFNQFTQFINAIGISQVVDNQFTLILKATERESGDYSSKLIFKLSPAMTTRQAVKIILRFLLQIIKKNEAGIQADIDTEFLHDFRVAVRRTRSALTQIKGVFPKEINDRFKQDFAHLGKMTNRMRDLDVYLLKKQQYQQIIPAYLHPGLDQLFDNLANERKAEFNNLVNALNSESYSRIISAWETFLNTAEENHAGETKNSQKAVMDIAKKFIHKAHNRVMKIGNQITAKTPDTKLHQLRIACKKLRYLLEFFAALFPADEIEILIKQLKKLQTNLGDFNDLSVQQESLKSYLETIIPADPESLKISASIGGLITGLYQKQQHVRAAFAEAFQEFSRGDNVERYQRLFMI